MFPLSSTCLADTHADSRSSNILLIIWHTIFHESFLVNSLVCQVEYSWDTNAMKSITKRLAAVTQSVTQYERTRKKN
jgi:hypothetical protein